MSRLATIILTYNEEKHIVDCIDSLRFADMIVVFDSYSTDQTVSLAQKAGATVIQNPFENYAQQRNAALKMVEDHADWVLFVDADERVTDELAAEVRAVTARDDSYEGWQVPRHNYIFGHMVRGAGWYPDYQLRLLKIGSAHYDPKRKVHELVILNGGDSALGTLQNPLIHYNYETAEQFAQKQRRYTAYEAKIMYEQNIRPKPQNYILQPLRHFKWRYFTLKGYRDGWIGFRLSALMAWYELKKYLILRSLWQKGRST